MACWGGGRLGGGPELIAPRVCSGSQPTTGVRLASQRVTMSLLSLFSITLFSIVALSEGKVITVITFLGGEDPQKIKLSLSDDVKK